MVQAVTPSRRAKGQIACSTGRLGEDAVCRDYLDRGYELISSRWRGKSGEIDLILRQSEEYVFVEVKTAIRHDYAAGRIGQQQIDRIFQTAMEFCAELASGTLTLMRFDAALVDHAGKVEIIENAFSLA